MNTTTIGWLDVVVNQRSRRDGSWSKRNYERPVAAKREIKGNKL